MGQRQPDRVDQIVLEVGRDQVRDHFGVSLAAKEIAALLKLTFEQGVVFDDAIVNDGHGSIAAQMGMGVGVGGAAMRGPAGVADARTTGSRLPLEE